MLSDLKSIFLRIANSQGVKNLQDGTQTTTKMKRKKKTIFHLGNVSKSHTNSTYSLSPFFEDFFFRHIIFDCFIREFFFEAFKLN